jgi:translation initiation factor 2A
MSSVDNSVSTSISEADIAKLPPKQLLIRSNNKLALTTANYSITNNSDNANIASIENTAEYNSTYSPDGTRLAVIKPTAVEIYNIPIDNNGISLYFTIPRVNVSLVQFSPQSNYVVTYERKSVDQLENCRVYSLSHQDSIYSIHHKSEIVTNFNRPSNCYSWPIQFSADESILAHKVSNELKFFSLKSGNLSSQPITKLFLPNIEFFALSSSSSPLFVAAFTPVSNQEPARVNIYNYPIFDKLVSSRAFFKAESMELAWSKDHQLLALSQTATDKTGSSYYGETNLYLFSPLNSSPDNSIQITFNNNPGPILDFAFNPTGKEFIVIQGNTPAKTIAYRCNDGKAIKEYCTAPRNTIRFSPHGRFVMIGGFGNLAGEMDFFDCFKFKLIGSAKDSNGAKYYSFSPDGRLFLTAVLRPWRRVDNQFKVFSYAGELLYKQTYEELYQCQFRPSDPNIYPNRPQSPRLKALKKEAATNPAHTTKPAAYIPPHMRNRTAADNSTAQLLHKEKQNTGPRKIKENGISSDKSDESQLTRNQQKSVQKKEKKAREAAEAQAKAEAEAEQIRLEKERKKSQPLTEEEKAKRIKNVNKKLKQISELKAKLSNGLGLDSDQQAKIDAEEELLCELRNLSLQ